MTAELDEDEKALRGLVGPEEELDERLSGFHRVYYEITPRGSPKWAVRNWRLAIAHLKRTGATNAVIKAATNAKVLDLLLLIQSLKQVGAHAAGAWEAWHQTWVFAEVARIASENVPKTRRDPGSRRSIRASLTDRQRGTWEAFRKLRKRPSRGTGKRQRGLSKEEVATRGWEAKHQRNAFVLTDLILGSEPLGAVAQAFGLSNGALLERLRLALDSLQDAIDAAKSLKGPQQVPQEITKGHAERRPRKGPQQSPQEKGIGPVKRAQIPTIQRTTSNRKRTG